MTKLNAQSAAFDAQELAGHVSCGDVIVVDGTLLAVCSAQLYTGGRGHPDSHRQQPLRRGQTRAWCMDDGGEAVLVEWEGRRWDITWS